MLTIPRSMQGNLMFNSGVGSEAWINTPYRP